MTDRPFAWERSYPPTLSWDAPLGVGTLPTLLESAARRFGERPALEFNGKRMTYRELWSRVVAMAGALASLGVERGVSVALYLPNSPFHPLAFFGTLGAGGQVVHLSPLDSGRTLRYKLEDSGARILVTVDTPALLAHAGRLLEDRVIDRLVVCELREFTDDAEQAALPAGACALARMLATGPGGAPAAVSPGQIALLQYTGGTSGSPKGAMLTHANLTAAVAMYRAWYEGTGTGVGPADRVICALPLFHIYALTTILLLGLDRGMEILLRPRFDAEGILTDIETGRATLFAGVPTMWIALKSRLDAAPRDLSSLRAMSSGGAPLPGEIAEAIERCTGRCLGGGWGMTETSPAGTRLLPGQRHVAGLIGVPLPGIDMQVVALDDPRCRLPPAQIGEIRIRGPNVTAGYWRRPAQTAAAFVDGYFLTGDIGYMDERGSFFLLDRKEDMIISGGFNVYPAVIEQAIYEHPAVEEVIVVGVADDYRGQSAKAFVKLRAGADPFSLQDLREFLADKLGRHELPTSLEFRATLPRTAVGKLWRRALADESPRRDA